LLGRKRIKSAPNGKLGAHGYDPKAVAALRLGTFTLSDDSRFILISPLHKARVSGKGTTLAAMKSAARFIDATTLTVVATQTVKALTAFLSGS
jgi:hypothetical protein